MERKVLLIMGCMFFTSGLFAQDCYKHLRGQTVCSNGQTAADANPNTDNAAVAHKNQNGVTTTQTSNGGEAKTKDGVGVAQGRSGNAAVAQKNQNGVTTTHTSNGGEAKTKNGMGVSQGPNGTTCAKGENHQGCEK